MLDPDNKIDANSIWESPPRRQWILKFFGSLMLLGFLVGLMLGRFFHPDAQPQFANRIVQLQTYADGLGVCLRRSAQVQAVDQQGAYQLLIMGARGQSAQGEIVLLSGELVRWRVEPQDAHVRVVFVGLKPVVGQWHPRTTDGYWCADIQVSVADTYAD